MLRHLIVVEADLDTGFGYDLSRSGRSMPASFARHENEEKLEIQVRK